MTCGDLGLSDFFNENRRKGGVLGPEPEKQGKQQQANHSAGVPCICRWQIGENGENI